ncbi:hypothetical protein [Phenylobacterium sp.]|uniref:hypothetical protein n=1 Tax=Phenylobacterium sp. TaxID=1871053 RepID=UPI003BA8D1E4
MDWGLVWAAAGVVLAALSALIALIRWWQEREAKKGRASEFTIEGSSWVFERGLSYEGLLQRLIGLDHAALAGLGDKTEGSAEQWAPVFEKSPETWGLVVFRGSFIVGYWSLFSISQKLVGALKRGQLYDSKIVSQEVRQVSEPGPHSLYFVMIARHPDFSRAGGEIFRLMMRSMAQAMASLRKDRVHIDAIYANATSAEGESLCRTLGLEAFSTSVQGGQVYKIEKFDLLEQRLARLGRLAGPRAPKELTEAEFATTP